MTPRSYPAHTTRSLRRALTIAVAGCLLPWLGLAEATAGPVMLTDILEISIPDQSQWGAGTVVPPGQWELKLVNVHEDVTIGEIVQAGVTIKNPAHIAWQTAYNACRVAFSHNVCINGATIPFVGHVGGLGTAPAATITVPLGKNGLELDASLDLEAGFFGNFGLKEGTFSVDYSAAVALTSEQASYVPGQVATITFAETAPEAITMATNGAQVEFNVGAFVDVDVDASMEIWAAGLGGPLDLVDLDTGRVDVDLFNAYIGDSGIHLDVSDSSTRSISQTALPPRRSRSRRRRSRSRLVSRSAKSACSCRASTRRRRARGTQCAARWSTRSCRSIAARRTLRSRC